MFSPWRNGYLWNQPVESVFNLVQFRAIAAMADRKSKIRPGYRTRIEDQGNSFNYGQSGINKPADVTRPPAVYEEFEVHQTFPAGRTRLYVESTTGGDIPYERIRACVVDETDGIRVTRA